MFGRLVHFFSYHNAIPLAALFIFLTSGVALAQSEVVQEQVISEQTIVRSIDNGYIVSVDLDDFDPRLRVMSVTEDEDFYFVEYTYHTIVLADYVWQDLEVAATLSVAKRSLGERDLGLYVAEQLDEEIDAKLAYLRDVQKVEKQKGVSRKVATTEYSGLVGRYLDSEEKVFDGYKPLKDEPKPVVASVQEAKASDAVKENNELSAAVAKALPSKAELQALIQGQVNQLLASGAVVATATTTTPSDDDSDDDDADDDDDTGSGGGAGTATSTATSTGSGGGATATSTSSGGDTATSTDTGGSTGGSGGTDTSTSTPSGGDTSGGMGTTTPSAEPEDVAPDEPVEEESEPTPEEAEPPEEEEVVEESETEPESESTEEGGEGGA